MSEPERSKEIEGWIRNGDAEALQQALEEEPGRAAEPLSGGVTPILFALYHAQPRIAGLIRARGGAPGCCEAAALGEVAHLSEILRADPGAASARSGDGMGALHLAAYFGRTDAVHALLDAGADANVEAAHASRVRPIHSPAAGSHAAVARALLEAGADPDARQAGGWTALQASAKRGDIELVRLLLARNQANTG